jgi:hypothetical protein
VNVERLIVVVQEYWPIRVSGVSEEFGSTAIVGFAWPREEPLRLVPTVTVGSDVCRALIRGRELEPGLVVEVGEERGLVVDVEMIAGQNDQSFLS